MTPDWRVDAGAVRTISSEPDDRENYVSGLRADSRYFYMTYKQAVGAPPSGEQRAMIKIFDHNLNLLAKEQVRTEPWVAEGGEIRPSKSQPADCSPGRAPAEAWGQETPRSTCTSYVR